MALHATIITGNPEVGDEKPLGSWATLRIVAADHEADRLTVLLTPREGDPVEVVMTPCEWSDPDLVWERREMPKLTAEDIDRYRPTDDRPPPE